MKNLLPHTALKSLYYTLIHSHTTNGIHTWGNANSIEQLFVLQKRAIRIINNKKYRTHTEPLFKSDNILKMTDLYKLHVSLFMFDLQNVALPLSFKTYLHQRNAINHSPMHTRQHDLIQKERPRTNFSAKLPRHNFTNICNGISTTILKATHGHKFKSLLRQHYLDQYKSKVKCINPTCIDCRS